MGLIFFFLRYVQFFHSDIGLDLANRLHSLVTICCHSFPNYLLPHIKRCFFVGLKSYIVNAMVRIIGACHSVAAYC